MSSECFGIYVYKNGHEKTILNLERFNFFYRNRIKDILLGTSKEIFSRTNEDNDIDLELSSSFINIHLVGVNSKNGFCLMYTTEKKPHEYLFNLARQILLDGLKETIEENFLYVGATLKIKEINSVLSDTKQILVCNVEMLLKRGEKIDDMLIASEYLMEESKKFVIETKKLNSCCQIL